MSSHRRAGARRSFVAGLIGQGIGPSLTPELHEREAVRQGIRYAYKVIELSDQQVTETHLRRLLDFAVDLGFDGLNVTHPVKQVMVPLVDGLTEQAEAIGAVNTVLVRDGRTSGHNTDVTGFAAALRDGLPGAPLEQVVLLGAGGAGTAVAHALAGLGAGELFVVDPDPARAARLVASLESAESGTTLKIVPPDEIAQHLRTAGGLVNATPVGMAAHPGMPCSADLLHDELWVADIVYRPLVTEMLRTAADRGCRTLDGAGMAVHQAGDAFELITTRPADRAAMFRDFDQIVASETDSFGSNRRTHDRTE